MIPKVKKKHISKSSLIFFFLQKMGFCFVFAWNISCELAMNWKQFLRYCTAKNICTLSIHVVSTKQFYPIFEG